MFTIMGASGHTGHRIVRVLLDRGHSVRALGRSEAKLAELRDRGAETLAGDAADPAFLSDAFRGADAVFTMIPPAPRSPDHRAFQDRCGAAGAAAIRNAGIPRVVFLSSLGAELPQGTGPIAGLHAQEARLRELGVDVLILRSAYFFENFVESLPMIRQQGINGGPLAAELRIPMIATRDVAEAAAAALVERNWQGVLVRELLGERDLSFAEATEILGAALGCPNLAYVQFSYDNACRALVQVGLSPSAAATYVELARALNDGRVASREGRTAANTTPTRFEDFAAELART